MGDETFARLIKKRRDALGLSQARLGELVGRSASTIRNWERASSLPSERSDVVALAAVLGLDESRILEEAGFEAPVVEKRPTIEEAYASLTTEAAARYTERPPEPEPPVEPEPTVEPEPPAEPEPTVEPEPPAEPEPTVEPEPTPDLESAPDSEPIPAPEPISAPEPASEPGPTGEAQESALAAPETAEPPEPTPAPEPEPGVIERDVLEEEPSLRQPQVSDVTVPDPDVPIFVLRPRPVDASPVRPWARQEASAEPVPEPPKVETSAPPAEPVETEPPRAEAAELRGRRRAAPPTVLEAAAPLEPSYIEDPDEVQNYRIRAVVTGVVILALFIVLMWSFRNARESLGEMWEQLIGSLDF